MICPKCSADTKVKDREVHETDLPPTAKAAKAAGSVHYFTGAPCKKGHLSPRRTSGRVCIACAAESAPAKYERHREAEKASSRRRYRADPEKHAEQGRQWRLKNIDRFREAQRQRYARGGELTKAQALARGQAWYERNKTACKEKSRLRNIELRKCPAYVRSVTEKVKAWKSQNPDRVKVYSSINKAKRRGAEGRYTKGDIERIMSSQKCRCAYCREGIKSGYHIDHIRPIALGGSNFASNIQLLCETCNLRKGAKDPVVFAQSRGMLL